MRRKCASFECWAERVVRSCRKLLDASGACISVVDDTGKLVNVVFSGSTGGPGAARSRLSASARRVRTRAYLSGEVAYENDTPSRKKGRSQHRGAGVTGRALFAPMITDGVVHGMLGVFGKRAGFDDYDARVASAFAEIAGLALQSHRTLLALRRGEEAFRGIARRDASCAAALRALREVHAEVGTRMSVQLDWMIASNERLGRERRERIKVDKTLRDSESKYRIIVDNTFDWEWWLGPDGRFVHMSPSCKRITGLDPQDFVAEPELIMEIVHPDDRATFTAHRTEVDSTHKGGSVEFRIVRPNGTHRWIAHVCQPIFDDTGRFLGHRGSNRDITERRHAEDAVRRSEDMLRTLSTQLLNAQETGRKRVAREIHDGVNQTLTAIKFALETKLDQMPKDAAPPGISLEKIISMVQYGIEETRRIQMDLRPPLLDDLGIVATLSWFTREFQSVYRHIRVEKDIEAAEDEIPHVLKIVIFRIVQEALNNVAKHSRANMVRLGLRLKGGGIELTIADNGRGFDHENAGGGFGLMSMRERAELSGGAFAIESAAGRGTTLRAVWPPRQW